MTCGFYSAGSWLRLLVDRDNICHRITSLGAGSVHHVDHYLRALDMAQKFRQVNVPSEAPSMVQE